MFSIDFNLFAHRKLLVPIFRLLTRLMRLFLALFQLRIVVFVFERACARARRTQSLNCIKHKSHYVAKEEKKKHVICDR